MSHSPARSSSSYFSGCFFYGRTDELCLPPVIENSQRILVAGAGGGFDVYAGLPIYERLRLLGKKVYLANLSYVSLGTTNAHALMRALYAVEPTTNGEDSYFPERTLAQCLSQRGENVRVYAFEKLGFAPIRDCYGHLVQSLGLDAIVLVDGGTDILLRGDEAGLGTPSEDIASLAAVAAMHVPTRVVVICVGFGVDSYHGVCHANWLEKRGSFDRRWGIFRCHCLARAHARGWLVLDAVNAADMTVRQRPSIVNGRIVSAIEGHFGDYHRNPRTQSSKLFVNPLMSFLWAFDLAAVAWRNLYLDCLANTETQRPLETFISPLNISVKRCATVRGKRYRFESPPASKEFCR